MWKSLKDFKKSCTRWYRFLPMQTSRKILAQCAKEPVDYCMLSFNSPKCLDIITYLLNLHVLDFPDQSNLVWRSISWFFECPTPLLTKNNDIMFFLACSRCLCKRIFFLRKKDSFPVIKIMYSFLKAKHQNIIGIKKGRRGFH